MKSTDLVLLNYTIEGIRPTNHADDLYPQTNMVKVKVETSTKEKGLIGNSMDIEMSLLGGEEIDLKTLRSHVRTETVQFLREAADLIEEQIGESGEGVRREYPF